VLRTTSPDSLQQRSSKKFSTGERKRMEKAVGKKNTGDGKFSEYPWEFLKGSFFLGEVDGLITNKIRKGHQEGGRK